MSLGLKEQLNRDLAARRRGGAIARGTRSWYALQELRGGEAVLDLGAGRGELVTQLRARYRRVVAADLVVDQIEAPDTVERVKCDFDQTLPWQDASFDGVASLDVIEHVLDPILFLAEIHRVLRPGGFAVLSTPNTRSLRHVLGLVIAGRGPRTSADRELHPWDGGHLHYFTTRDVREMAAQAGFETCVISGMVIQHGRYRAARTLASRAAGTGPIREFVCGGFLARLGKRG